MHQSLADILRVAWHRKPKMRPSFGELTMKLDDSLINSAVTNEEAANFWREHWGRVRAGVERRFFTILGGEEQNYRNNKTHSPVLRLYKTVLPVH